VPHEPQDPDWESRVREAFAAQTMMETLGVSLVALEPGRVELRVPFVRPA
jgi:acyl-coenzyme A thioesterase PaaI-like protein